MHRSRERAREELLIETGVVLGLVLNSRARPSFREICLMLWC